MKTLLHPSKFHISRLAILTAALLVLFCAPRTSAADAVASDGDGAYCGLVPVPDKLTLPEIKDRVVQSFRKFQILAAGNDFVVGYYERGYHKLTLTVRFDTKNIKLYAKPDPADVRRWIDNYRKTLSKNLYTSAR
jgi:hypothetical protein